MVVGDAKPASKVDELKLYAHLCQLLCNPHHHFSGPAKGSISRIWEPMWQWMPAGRIMPAGKGFPVRGGDLLMRDAELARRKAGRNLRVGGHAEGRVHPERDLCYFSGSFCCRIELVEFVKGIGVIPSHLFQQRVAGHPGSWSSR